MTRALNTKKAKKPLAGRQVVITRRKEQAGPLRRALEREGAKVMELPTIAIVAPESWAPLDTAIANLPDYDWLIFTSTNGVDFFFERLRKQRKTRRALSGKRVAAIGSATAKALRKRGVRVRVVPDEFVAEALLKALGRTGWCGKRVLLARAAEARQILPRELRKRGAKVDVVATYRTIVPEASRKRAKKIFGGRKPDAITFTSSSTVKNFFALTGKRQARSYLKGVTVSTIGPVTSRTARTLGLKVGVEAKPYTVEGLARSIARKFS